MKINAASGAKYSFEKSKLLKDGKEIDQSIEIIPKGNGCFQLIRDNRSFDAFLVAADRESKSFEIKIDGHTYQLQLEDRYDALLKQLGIDDMASAKAMEIKAPMPGLVLKIVVEVGGIVAKGDPVIVLEAMKMENILKAPADGTVKQIHTETAQAVEKNQLLVSFE